MAESELNGGVQTQADRDIQVYESGLRLGCLWDEPKFLRFMFETERIHFPARRAMGGFLSAMKLSGSMASSGMELLAAYDAWNVGENRSRLV